MSKDFENSLTAVTSPPETLTGETFAKCGEAICAATANAISSPALVDGPSPCGSPDGLTMDLFGQEAAPVSHSAKQATDLDSPTLGTYSRRGLISAASADLQRSLASRLLARLGSFGPIGPQVVLKPRTMPSGRQFFRLLVSGVPCAETGFILLPTPSAQTQEGGLRLDGGARSRQRWKELGLLPDGTAAKVAMAGWLMGYPDIWQRKLLAALETRSSQNSPRSS